MLLKLQDKRSLEQLEMPKLDTVFGENRGLGAKLIPESFSLYGRWKIGEGSCFDEVNFISTINIFFKILY